MDRKIGERMEYICHTEEDIDKMLKAIKKKNISELFKDVPKKLLSSGLRVPQGLSEIELKRLMNGLASKNKTGKLITKKDLRVQVNS